MTCENLWEVTKLVVRSNLNVLQHIKLEFFKNQTHSYSYNMVLLITSFHDILLTCNVCCSMSSFLRTSKQVFMHSASKEASGI